MSVLDLVAAMTLTLAYWPDIWANTSPVIPTVIVRNMPGGGSLRVANYIYSAAPKDGSELGAIAASAAMDALLGTIRLNSKPPSLAGSARWTRTCRSAASGTDLKTRKPSRKFRRVRRHSALTGAGATSYTASADSEKPARCEGQAYQWICRHQRDKPGDAAW